MTTTARAMCHRFFFFFFFFLKRDQRHANSCCFSKGAQSRYGEKREAAGLTSLVNQCRGDPPLLLPILYLQ